MFAKKVRHNHLCSDGYFTAEEIQKEQNLFDRDGSYTASASHCRPIMQTYIKKIMQGKKLKLGEGKLKLKL